LVASAVVAAQAVPIAVSNFKCDLTGNSQIAYN